MKYVFLILLFFSTSFKAFTQDPWKNVYKEDEWKQRDTWQRPNEIIKQLNITTGSKVADVGCNEGYFTIKIAQVVQNTGIVYAVDISQNKLEKLKAHLKSRQLTNVNLILGKEDNPLLPEKALDAVLIVDTYHEMDAHEEMLRHIHQSLKPDGRLVLCEPIADERKTLLREQQERSHELDIKFALADLKKAGFKILFQQESYIDRRTEKGDTMWLIVAEKSK